MKVLYKSDTDYIPLPSKDPFVQTQQALLIEMGYRLIEYEPPVSDSVGDDGSSLPSASETPADSSGTSSPSPSTASRSAGGSEASVSETDEPEETFTTTSGKTITKSELEALLKNL